MLEGIWQRFLLYRSRYTHKKTESLVLPGPFLSSELKDLVGHEIPRP